MSIITPRLTLAMDCKSIHREGGWHLVLHTISLCLNNFIPSRVPLNFTFFWTFCHLSGFFAGTDTLIPLGCWNLPSSSSVTSEHVQTDQDPYKCLSECNVFFGFGTKNGGTCICLSEFTSAGRSNKCNAPCPNGYVDPFNNRLPLPGYLCGSTDLTVINVYQKRPG